MRQSKIVLLTFLIGISSFTATANDKTNDPNKGMAWMSGEGGTRAPVSGGQNEIKTDDTAGSQAAAEKPKPKPKPSGGGKSLPMEEISMNYTKVQSAPKKQPNDIASPQKSKQGQK